MKIELRNIDDVKPYERNPRINDQAIDARFLEMADSSRPDGPQGIQGEVRAREIADRVGRNVGYRPWDSVQKITLVESWHRSQTGLVASHGDRATSCEKDDVLHAIALVPGTGSNGRS